MCSAGLVPSEYLASLGKWKCIHVIEAVLLFAAIPKKGDVALSSTGYNCID